MGLTHPCGSLAWPDPTFLVGSGHARLPLWDVAEEMTRCHEISQNQLPPDQLS